MTATAVRPSWNELPEPLRDGLATRLGSIQHAEVQTGGFTPGLAVRLQLTSGERAFVKGIAADHVLADRYRTEAHVVAELPTAVPAPALRWTQEMAGWVVLAFDDASGRHANLAPGSPDIGRVVDMLIRLGPALTPCPLPHAPVASVELADFVHGWRELAAEPPADLDPWARRNMDRLAKHETTWLSAADGNTLLHGDINASNLLITNDKVLLIDWAQPVRGASWIDIADLIPHLILAGHTPPAAEQAVARAVHATGVDAQTITSYAVAFAGYWTRMSRRPAPPGVPNLRGYQARAATAALAWVAHRTRWPTCTLN
ncbi:phosphotransferase family protein [Actinomadura sp. 9N407]|uniref:phosphotransferase family protein n=1 Tax=Actinomadura sp. 9N407 TaxID=3375154 RepID=UPI0037B8B6F9